jgi:hypothetical protein
MQDPTLAAEKIFMSHYAFYAEDPTSNKTWLTPRLFRVLKHHHDDFNTTGLIGPLEWDPWINAQDGNISKPYRFQTLRKTDSEAVVQLDYRFARGPKDSLRQTVLLKFECSGAAARWELADLIMPGNKSLLELLEKNP